jgi:hypothetical protein
MYIQLVMFVFGSSTKETLSPYNFCIKNSNKIIILGCVWNPLSVGHNDHLLFLSLRLEFGGLATIICFMTMNMEWLQPYLMIVSPFQ